MAICPYNPSTKRFLFWEEIVKTYAVLALGIVALLLTACGDIEPQNADVSQSMQEGAYNLMSDRMDNVNEGLPVQLFSRISLTPEEARLVLTVTDTWYGLPDYMQERIVSDWTSAWTRIAGNYGWTGLARFQMLDQAGKQVAYESRMIPH